MPDDDKMLDYTPPKRLKLVGLSALAVAVVVVALGLFSRLMTNQSVARWTESEAIPTVKVINLSASDDERSLVLPGDIQAFNSAPIYARVSGYLKKWYADIGAPVKAGQLLAEIDIPDQDQELAQAKADLGTAVANEKLSALTAVRYNHLLSLQAVSPQDVDQRNGDLAAKRAASASARANVQRLQALEGFKRITAPFDGVVTSRSVDIGALISVGTPTAVPLFTVSDESKLRVYVRVPQNYSGDIVTGMKATFTVPDYPGRIFNADVMATAGAVDTTTGTVLAQLQLDNSGHVLKPGSYAQVHFALAKSIDTLQIPASALIFRQGGMQVATVDGNNHVAIRPVTIRQDFGSTVEIGSGLTHPDRVIDNPPDSLRNGDPVHPAKPNNPG